MSRLPAHPVAALAVAVTALGALALSGCSAMPAGADDPTGPAADGLRVAVIGDSIEAGLGLDQGQSWPELLATELGWTLDNASSSGAGFVATDDDGDDFGPQVEAAIASGAQLVLIGASDNDLGTDAGALEASTATAVERLRGGLPGATIVGFPALTGMASDEQLADADAALRHAVESVGGTWLAFEQPYRDRPGLVQDDGEHPTAEGQRAIADAVAAALARAGLGTLVGVPDPARTSPSPANG